MITLNPAESYKWLATLAILHKLQTSPRPKVFRAPSQETRIWNPTPEQARVIKNNTMSYTEMAETFGVTRKTILAYRKRKGLT